MKYIFGPVPSRRLGRSLGINLLPFKTCSLDCVYCECGRTTDLSITPIDFFPVKDVLAELDLVLAKNPQLDYITFSGSGEPLLYKSIDQIIDFVGQNYPHYKIALLTNSIGLAEQTIWDKIKAIDLIVPSIDSVILAEFQKINRPHPDVDLEQLLVKLLDFRKTFQGKFYVEYFIVPSVNDSQYSVKQMKKYLTKLQPDLIQLNRLDRPGTEKILRADDQLMLSIRQQLLPLPVEAVGKFSGTSSSLFDNNLQSVVTDLLAVRAVDFDDLLKIAGCERATLKKLLQQLSQKQQLIQRQDNGKVYYRLIS